MVKKRNHYIPQFLLRRFASREGRGRHWLWQFRSSRVPVEVVTRDAAVECHFYGPPETGVEDSFAELEGKQAALLRDLDAGTNPADRSRELHQFIWSLAFRTRALRGQFADVGERGIAKISAVDPKTIEHAFGREIATNFDQHLERLLEKLPAEQRAAAERLLQSPGIAGAVKEHVLREMTKVAPMVGGMLKPAAAAMQGAAANGHIQGLTKLFAEGKAVPDGFEVPSWSMQQFSPHSVLLGDGVVFAVGPGEARGALGRFTKDYVAIYAPISHACVLIGRRDRSGQVLGLDDINEASAKLSLDTFFASRSTDVERGLAGQIGTGQPILSDEELRHIAEESWNKLGVPRSDG